LTGFRAKSTEETTFMWDLEELKRNIYADRLISNRPEPRL
jgi:hypothetical protein